MTRRNEIFESQLDRLHRQTDRMFFWLLLGQWLLAIVLAFVLSPYEYAGEARRIHFHVWAALGFGAVLNSLPLVLIWLRPGWWVTRQLVAVVQVVWSALLIMITGGRIETHFHIFGSLAFLAFYRDWKVIATATAVVAFDHLTRGLLWPDSVYGIANPEWWRFLEHAAWVLFEDTVLVFGCHRAIKELRVIADHAARIERTNVLTEKTVQQRTRQLQESSDRYRTLVENIDAITFEYDAARRELLYLAPQATRLLECTVSELRAPGLLAEVIHPDDYERVTEALTTFSRHDRAPGEPLEFRLVARSGRTAAVRAFLSRSDDHRVRGVILDVTVQRRLEFELRQAQRLESVGRLAAGVAHEINTPIQFVSDSVLFVRDALADLVRVTEKYQATADCVVAHGDAFELATTATATAVEADLPYLCDQLPKALDRALDGTGRVAAIVRSMKVFAYEDRGEAVLVDLVEAITSTLTIARSEYKLVADVELRCEPLPLVCCHVGELNQVFLNLVINAAHAIADVVDGTSKRGTITVTTRSEDDLVVVSIADTGGGIPDAIRDRIFDPFFTTKAVGRGTGQGLSIARSVIAKHGGSLTFDSIPGKGATFHIRLPIAPATVAALEPAA